MRDGCCVVCGYEQWDWVHRCSQCKVPCCPSCQSASGECIDCENEAPAEREPRMSRAVRDNEADPMRAQQLISDALGKRPMTEPEGVVLFEWIQAVRAEHREDIANLEAVRAQLTAADELAKAARQRTRGEALSELLTALATYEAAKKGE